jgi:hypothetical protein
MRVPRPSPALVVACLALVVAAGQPVANAVSALVPTNSVGTAQLKDGAVTTPKLHDGAVTNRKIAPSTITGGRIANGTVGLLDLAASARPTPPRAYVDTGDDVLPENGLPVDVASLDLPAGSWVLIAKAVATTTSNGSFGDVVNCHLFVGDNSLDYATSYSQVSSQVPQYYTQTIPLTALATVGVTTTVYLRCSEDNDGLTSSIGGAKLIAIQVTP